MKHMAYFSLLFLATSVVADEIAPKKPIPGRVPAVGTAFRLRVQAKPQYPNAERPSASAATAERGLSVTIQPEKAAFALNERLAFIVVVTNESKRPFRLQNISELGGKPKLVVANFDSAAQWTVAEVTTGDGPKSIQLEPGKSATLHLVVNGQIQPQPRPRPLPIRRNAAAQDVRKPGPNGPFQTQAPLPCGAGKCRTRLLLEFKADGGQKGQTVPAWVGKIASKPVDFTVTAARPPVIVRPPVVPQLR